MTADWYYKKGDRSFGPIDAPQLKALASSGALTVDDMVMREGHGKWVKASDIKGLFAHPLPTGGSKQTLGPASSTKQDADDDDFYESTVQSSEADPDDNVVEGRASRVTTPDESNAHSLDEVLNVLVQSQRLLSEINQRDKSRITIPELSVLDWVVVLVKFSVAYALIAVVTGVVVGILVAILTGMAASLR